MPPHNELIFLDDLNASPSCSRSGFEPILGPFGSGSSNDNSIRLLSFCASQNISITGSWFRRRDIYRMTWISNDGRTQKELEHILVKNRNIVKSYRVFRGAEAPVNTDHRLLIARIAVSPRFHSRKPSVPMYDVHRVTQDKALALRYSVAIHNKF